MNGRLTSANWRPAGGKNFTGEFLLDEKELQTLERFDKYNIESRLISFEEKIGYLLREMLNLKNLIHKYILKDMMNMNKFEEPIKLTKKEAKKSIIELFQKEKNLGYSDIIEKLGVNLDLVVTICKELEKEKKIKSIK
jgi:hypothetical protein